MTYFSNLKLYKWEIPFFMAYVLYIGSNILKTTVMGFDTDSLLFKGIIVACLSLLMLKEFLKQEFGSRAFFAVILIGAMMYIIHLSKSFTVATFLIFIFCARDIDYKKIAAVTMWLTIAECSLIILMSKVGMITNYVMDEESTRPREFLGYLYALFPAAYLFNIIALHMYIKKDKMNWFWIAGYWAANIWIYKKTDARLSFCFICILLVSIMTIKIVKKYKKCRYKAVLLGNVMGFGVIFSYVIVAISSLIILIKYDHHIPILAKINKIFANRLAYGHISYEKYGIKLLGQQIPWYDNGIDYSEQAYQGEKLYVDNLYLQFLQQYGIILAVLVLILVTVAMYRFFVKRDYYMLFILLIIAGHAMIDDMVQHIWINTFLIPIGQVLIKDTEVFARQRLGGNDLCTVKQTQ